MTVIGLCAVCMAIILFIAYGMDRFMEHVVTVLMILEAIIHNEYHFNKQKRFVRMCCTGICVFAVVCNTLKPVKRNRESKQNFRAGNYNKSAEIRYI